MKTRKLISGVFLLGCLLSGSRTNAQEINYYTGDRIKVYDKVYIINRPQDYRKDTYIEIWDSANVKKMFAPQYYPNGEEIPFYHGHFERLQYQDRGKIKEAVREVFSPEEIQKFKEKEVDLYVQIVVDSTGLIIEQRFDLAVYHWPILLSIPPEKLYHLEKKLQEKVRFNVENFEKQFGYTKGKVISIFFKDY